MLLRKMAVKFLKFVTIYVAYISNMYALPDEFYDESFVFFVKKITEKNGLDF